MCTCGYTPFLDRSFTPESFNTLSRASSSWTRFVKRPYNHLALCGWCSTLRVGTCSTSVSTSMGSISPHSRDTLITSPRTLRVVLDSTRRHVLNLLLALPGFVSPQSRDPLSRLWVRLPPFPTSSSQKSSVLSLSRWHRSTLSQRSFVRPLVDTPLSTREVWGFSLEGVPSLLFFFLSRHPYHRSRFKKLTLRARVRQ